MRILSIFLWILFGGIVLWFFSLNLDQYVKLKIFTVEYQNVNLVTIIFITFFLGLVIGALLLAAQVVRAKAQFALMKRENKKLQNELESMRNLSVAEIPEPEPDTDIKPDTETN